jgi:hypothetical protein
MRPCWKGPEAVGNAAGDLTGKEELERETGVSRTGGTYSAVEVRYRLAGGYDDRQQPDSPQQE